MKKVKPELNQLTNGCEIDNQYLVNCNNNNKLQSIVKFKGKPILAKSSSMIIVIILIIIIYDMIPYKFTIGKINKMQTQTI